MLLSLKVENFLSFKDVVQLDLIPSSIKELEENVAISSYNNSRVLKSAVVYGANSSGKSNLLNALIFIKRFVMNSSKNTVDEGIGVQSFLLSSRTESRPSCFEINFVIDAIKYRYSFTVDRHYVHKESLYFTKVNKEYLCFERNGDNYTIDPKFTEAINLSDKTRPNALFLSVIAQFNGKISSSILQWFNGIKYISDTNKPTLQNYTAKLLDVDKYNRLIVKFLNHINLGFSDIKVEKINTEVYDIVREILGEGKNTNIIKTEHIKYDENGLPIGSVFFNLNKNESLGSQKLFAISGLIIESLATGKLLIIDELDARLHPSLTLSVVKLFNSSENNPKNAQLIFATHNTHILSNKYFRRDQVLLAAKDKFGSTSINSLNNLPDKKVRIDESYEKNYLAGDYGAIPELNSTFKLFDDF